MANKKIQELTLTNTLTDDYMLITQENSDTAETKRTLLSTLVTYLKNTFVGRNVGNYAERFNDYSSSGLSKTAGMYSHAEGSETTASGDYSHAEGLTTTASGSDSHSEGHNSVASGFASHAEGDGTTASGDYSHTEGYYTQAQYTGHAEGWYTKAINTSHAEGNYTQAVGYKSHAEGDYTVATGEASHAGGIQTIAAGVAQTAIGKYNVSDTTSLFIIGCGTYDERKNALLVDAEGNLTVLGTIKAEGGFEGIESGGTINVWTATTDYAENDVVINETTLYKCDTAHTSGDTFDSTNWTALTGEKGADGEKGDNGVTPHIDETTKHWFIGETDTGVLAEGADGADGVSPTVTVTQTDSGAEISVTDGSGTTTATLNHGTTTVTTSAIVYNGILTADGWTGDTAPYTQAVTISGIDETSRPYLYPVLSDTVETGLEEQKQWGYITKAATSADTITFSCYKTKPTVDINFEAEVR